MIVAAHSDWLAREIHAIGGIRSWLSGQMILLKNIMDRF